MKKSTIKKELNPTKKFKIPAGWVSTRRKAYKAFRIEQARKMRDRVPTEAEQAIIKRKHEIMALHEAKL